MLKILTLDNISFEKRHKEKNRNFEKRREEKRELKTRFVLSDRWDEMSGE